MVFRNFDEETEEPVRYFMHVMNTVRNETVHFLHCVEDNAADIKSLESTVKKIRKELDDFHMETKEKIKTVEVKLQEHEEASKEYKDIKAETAVIDAKLQDCRIAVEEYQITKGILKTFENKLEGQGERIKGIEIRSRKNNVVVHGVDQMIDMYNQKEWFRQFFVAKLKLNPKIVSVFKLGKLNAPGVPFLVTFKYFQDKMYVFSNSYMLKQTDPQISIQDDLCPEDREKRRKLIPTLERLRSQGKKAGFRGAFLYVDGYKYDPAQDTETKA